MSNPAIYRRPPLLNRPWVAGKLYDDITRKAVIHCDAYVVSLSPRLYLVLDWREGGRERIAMDAWLIEPDGLTPVWNTDKLGGVPVHSTDAALHARVIAQVEQARVSGRWTRVSVLCHYINVREIDGEISDNKYVERAAYKPRITTNTLPDIL